MQKITVTGLIFVLLLCFSSCESNKDDNGCEIVDDVLLVYMGGDNDEYASNDSYQKIEAIRKGWKGDCTKKVIIYHDPLDTTPALFEVTTENGQNTLKTIEQYPEEDSASPEVFKRVINKAKELYPTSSHGLLLFSHASGWLPKRTLSSPSRSIIIDGTNEMELRELASAIPDRAFEYIIFEACFMAGIEVAYELKDKTNYIVASSAEIVSPGFAAIYPNSLTDLLKSPADLTSFTTKAFNYFNNQSSIDYRSATLSVINTSQLEQLKIFVETNCDFTKLVNIRDYQRFDRYTSYRLFFDFEDYYASLLSNDQQKEELKQLIDKCIVYKASTSSFMPNFNGFEIKSHSGMTTYILQNKFPYLNSEYMKLKWAEVLE